MKAIRRAAQSDIPQIMRIIAEAQAFLAARGVDQWQDGYPDEQLMRQDIAEQTCHVLEAEGGEILGIVTIVLTGEPTYAAIFDGAWRTEEPYACFHRVAVGASQRGSGAAAALMEGAERYAAGEGMRSVRIDTHRDNRAMLRMLEKNRYERCGVIFLADGAERIALEKPLL